MRRAGIGIEQRLHNHILAFAIAVWLLGILLLKLQTPVFIWGGLWTVFFLYMGSYCVRNFLHCREAHCAITGPGWIIVGVLAFLDIMNWLLIPQG